MDTGRKGCATMPHQEAWRYRHFWRGEHAEEGTTVSLYSKEEVASTKELGARGLGSRELGWSADVKHDQSRCK